MKISSVMLMFATSVLLAQGPPPDGPMGPGRGRGPMATDEVKAYLGLDQTQVDQLVQLRKDEREEGRVIFERIAANRKSLADALKATSPDAATVGNLMLETQKLRKQLRELNETYHSKAVALLKDAQKTKLAELEAAAKLRPVIGQAQRLNLLLPPTLEEQDEGMLGGPMAGPGPMGMRRLGAGSRFQR